MAFTTGGSEAPSLYENKGNYSEREGDYGLLQVCKT